MEAMKKYTEPTITAIPIESFSIMAASFDTNIGGGDTTDTYLSKENNGFSWDEDAWGENNDDDEQNY